MEAIAGAVGAVRLLFSLYAGAVAGLVIVSYFILGSGP